MLPDSTKLFGLSMVSLLALAGCGGNSDICGYDAYGDPLVCQATPSIPPLAAPVASSASFSIAQGLINIATQNYAYTVNSVDGYGNIYTIQYSSVPGQPALFGTTPASTANITQALSENSSTLQTITSTNYYIQSPYQFLGSVSNVPGGSEVVNSFQVAPVSGLVGQTFPSYAATVYRDSTNVVVDATLTETIGLSADTSTTALLCLTDTIQLTQAGISDNLSGGTYSNCFRIDPNGNVLGLQITTQINGMPMLFY